MQKKLETYLATNTRITSTATEHSYRMVLRSLETYLGRPATIEDLTDETIGGWIKHRLNTVAQNTARGEATKIRALWNWLSKREGIAPPTFVTPRYQRKTPQAWSKSELIQLFNAADECKRPVGDIPGNVYWLAILHLIWETGERIAAVHSLRTDDLEFPAVRFRADTRKGGSEEIVRLVSPDCVAAVNDLLSYGLHRPFAPIRLKAVYYHLSRLLIDAGLPHGRNCKFHRLRRSHASHLHAAGGDATQSLGHSSDAITIKSYLDPRITQPHQPHELLAGILGRVKRRRWWARLVG